MKVVAGIQYTEPEVIILQDTGIGHTEYAGRIAYGSFDKSENDSIQIIDEYSSISNRNYPEREILTERILELKNIESSNLLDSLAWVHHHHSVLEHSSITYLIKGIGRGVLQELVRHRIASYTVKSSRYTMSSIINAYIASSRDDEPRQWFIKKMNELNILITTQNHYNHIEHNTIYDKIMFQQHNLDKNEFIKLSISKSSLEYLDDPTYLPDELFKLLEDGKTKKNVGDNFKHIVTDNWKTDLVMTINLRSLKNFFELRNSGSAWFQIQWLAQAMKNVTPVKYLRLIDKKYKG